MNNLDKFTDQIILAVDSHYGKYTFQMLAENWGTPVNLAEFLEDWKLATNPENIENDWYYEAQWNILQNAIYKINGKRYRLESNEDLWFIPENVETPENWII